MSSSDPVLPPSLTYEANGAVGILRLNRPAKRNALNGEVIEGLHAFFTAPPPELRAVVLAAVGDTFSAGLDLGEVAEWQVEDGLHASMRWYRAFDAIESGTLPVIAVLRGAVIGGGFELVASTHIRVAERSAFFALPEATRGIFLGGGGAVRIPRLLGTARVMDMLLTGRVYPAEEAVPLGAAQYLVDDGAGLTTALELAHRIAANAPLSNYAALYALPRIAAAPAYSAFTAEAGIAAVVQSSRDAKQRIGDFLGKRAAKVKAP
jgi:enoyl-CoA hydratase/carnithine racemase